MTVVIAALIYLKRCIDEFYYILRNRRSEHLKFLPYIAMAAPTRFVCLLLSLCLFYGSSVAVIVNTTYGPVNGSVISLSTNKTVRTYLGIPFAKAERFEYPVPPDKWTSTLQANKTDKICPQPSLLGMPSRLSLMSEDCLLLNVYVPDNATSNSRLAVMLWIHGGAYIIEDTTSYDGSVLATEGNVIVVTAAYRLGVLGFLSSNSDNLKGNYGMLDQIEAMKWVNKNIERLVTVHCFYCLLLQIVFKAGNLGLKAVSGPKYT